MVLLSPPPLATSEIQADRVLIATGAIDVPRIRAFLPIAEDIGGAHIEAWILPWAGHSAAIFSPVYIKRVVDWLGGWGKGEDGVENCGDRGDVCGGGCFGSQIN